MCLQINLPPCFTAFCVFLLRQSSGSPLTYDFLHFSPISPIWKHHYLSSVYCSSANKPWFPTDDLPFDIGLNNSANHLDFPSRVSFFFGNTFPFSVSTHASCRSVTPPPQLSPALTAPFCWWEMVPCTWAVEESAEGIMGTKAQGARLRSSAPQPRGCQPVAARMEMRCDSSLLPTAA